MSMVTRLPPLLLHFLTVAEAGGVSKAARILGIPQPAVTRSIKRLEENYSTALFERLPRGMQLTPAGEVLARHARLIDAEYRNAQSEIAGMRGGHRGNINVGAGPIWLRHFLPRAVAQLHTSNPSVSVRVHVGSHDALIPRLHSGELDIALTAFSPYELNYDSMITHEVLIDDVLVLIARENHPLAKLDSIRAEQLIDYPWVVPANDAQNRDVLDAAFRHVGVPAPCAAVESLSVTFGLAILREGDYLSFQPSRYLASPEAQGIVALPFDGFSWRRATGISFRNVGTLSLSARTLIKELRNVVAAAQGKSAAELLFVRR